MFDEFIYLGCNAYTGTDKNDGHEYTTYRISFAVIPPDTFYEGYEVNNPSVKKEVYDKLSKLKPLDKFKGIVVRDPKKGLIIYRLD